MILRWISWRYEPSDEYSYILYYSRYGEEFDLNDLGYMRDETTMNGMQIFKEIGIKICILKSFITFIKTEFGGSKNNAGSASSYGGMRTLNSL